MIIKQNLVDLRSLKTNLIKACVNIDTGYLCSLNDKAYYSSNNKEELIEEFEYIFKRIPKDLTNLIHKTFICNYCYKGCETQAFYDHNDNLMFSIIVKDDGFEDGTIKCYIVQECKNKIVIPSNSEIPF